MSLQQGTKPGDPCPMWVSKDFSYSVYWQNAETELLYFRGGCWSTLDVAQSMADRYEKTEPVEGGVHVVVDDRTMTVIPRESWYAVYKNGRQPLSANPTAA